VGALEDLMSGAGGVADFVKKNPQLVAAAVSLLSTQKGSVGGQGGLGGLVSAFQNKGLGDVVQSWISTGPNQPISPAQITDVLGHDTLKELSQKAGLPSGDASSALASLLPALVNQFTPKGELPHSSSLESALGSLLTGLGH
jgi:uncharacterized protein YidB (DUF937 family)